MSLKRKLFIILLFTFITANSQGVIFTIHLNDSLSVDSVTTQTLLSGTEILSFTHTSTNKTLDSDLIYFYFIALLSFYNDGYFSEEDKKENWLPNEF